MMLETYLREHDVDFEKEAHVPTYTAQGLAHAEHVSGYMVAKPVVVRGKDAFYMCVLAAPHRVDLKRVAAAVNEPEVRLATEAEMAELFPDCELGAEPPVGAMFGLKTVMDERLAGDAVLVMQAGSHTQAVRVHRSDWQRLCDPVVAPISLA